MEDSFNLENISHPVDESTDFNVDEWEQEAPSDIDWNESDLSDNDLYRGTIE